jgi:hypothetical protein
MHIYTRIYMRHPYMRIYGSAHIRKVHIRSAYTEGAYTEEIYVYPNLCTYTEARIYGRCISYTEGAYTKVHIQKKFTVIQMHLPYMCAFIYEDLRKLSSVYAHLYVHLYASSVYAHIRKRAYTEDAIMEVANFRICIIRICTYTEARIYGRCIYGTTHIRKVHIQKVHIRKVHIQKKFTVIQMHLPYMCAFIYEDLRKLSSVYAHLYAHLYASSVYAHIRKRAYTEDAIMEVANFRICIVRICTYTEAYTHIYGRCIYIYGR